MSASDVCATAAASSSIRTASKRPPANAHLPCPFFQCQQLLPEKDLRTLHGQPPLHSELLASHHYLWCEGSAAGEA